MTAREKLDEFAEINGMNKNQLIGWSIAADFAEWYADQVKNCSIPDVVGRSERLTCECVGLGSTECHKINDVWLCSKCNRPLAG